MGFDMAGYLRHWKERNGRYSARIVIPPQGEPPGTSCKIVDTEKEQD